MLLVAVCERQVARAEPLQQEPGFPCRAVRQEDAELIAAVAPDDGGRRECLAQIIGQTAQRLISGIVAVEIVDALEIIDIDHDTDGPNFGELIQIRINSRIEALAVVEPRQRIGIGQLAKVTAAVLQVKQGMCQEGHQKYED